MRFARPALGEKGACAARVFGADALERGAALLARSVREDAFWILRRGEGPVRVVAGEPAEALAADRSQAGAELGVCVGARSVEQTRQRAKRDAQAVLCGEVEPFRHELGLLVEQIEEARGGGRWYFGEGLGRAGREGRVQ